MLDIMLKFLTNYGFPIGFVAFFIYRDYVREKSMSEKINSLEKQIQGILTDTLVKVTEVVKRNTALCTALVRTFNKRRCLLDTIEEPEHEDQNIAV